MKLIRLVKADTTVLKQINRLFLQLSTAGRQATLAQLKKAIADKNTCTFVAVEAGQIVGMATLLASTRLTGPYGYVQDVVVDEAQRGKGLGKLLMSAVTSRAKKLKIKEIRLSSNPSRIAANTLYQKLGFKQKETNVYRLEL